MKERLRKILSELGADVCGFANIDRFDEAPAGFHPRDVFPACLSVAVFGIALPKGLPAAAQPLPVCLPGTHRERRVIAGGTKPSGRGGLCRKNTVCKMGLL